MPQRTTVIATLATSVVFCFLITAKIPNLYADPKENDDTGELVALRIRIVTREGADPRLWSFTCEAINPNKSPIIFVGYRADSFDPPIPDGQMSPIYRLEVHRDGKWQPHPIGWCGTGIDGIELPPGVTRKFGFTIPQDLAGKSVRIGVSWSHPQPFDTAEPDAFSIAWSQPFAADHHHVATGKTCSRSASRN